MSLVKLPYELVAYVIQHLDLGEIRSLSLSCRKFQFLLHEPNIAKLILETKAPYSLEAGIARNSKRYGKELRRLIKRREAITSVSPYLVAIVGYADTWIYENGLLCYTRGGQLRILDLHHAATCEIVVNIRKLVDTAIQERREGTKYRFQLLYCAYGIISCLYTHANTPAKHAEGGYASWLVAFDPQNSKIIIVAPLDSTYKIFVRNDDKFLYYGTNSEMGRDGYRRWVIRGFDLVKGDWLDQRLDIGAVIGSDIGSTVTFGIFDGYFYGVSNQTSLEVEEVDWVSYYICFRFPLTRRGFQCFEQAPRQQFWRRDQAEGPIDDRWTFLRMFKDETTGQLKVVESRKEWLSARISARRTYYTTVIDFQDPAIRQAWDGPGRRVSSDTEPLGSERATTQKTNPAATVRRNPHLVHPGDDSASDLTFTLSKCPIRSYHPSCQTFLDLIDDSTFFEPNDQRIRIRGGSRRRLTPRELEQRKCAKPAPTSDHQDTFLEQTASLYQSEPVVFWPPDLNSSSTDPALADLYAILNPPGHVGNLHGSWDDRSLIYATGGKAKALVFISWDPFIRLAGIPAYPLHTLPGTPTSPTNGDSASRQSYLPTIPPHQGKGKNCDTAGWPPTSQLGASSGPSLNLKAGLVSEATNHPDSSSWRVFEPARYREVLRGYHFAR